MQKTTSTTRAANASNDPTLADPDKFRDPDLIPFRDWCRANGVGISTAYRLVGEGRLRLVHIGKRSYLNRENRAAFLKSLSQPA